MKILTAPQIRATDQHTIEHEPIASIDLMERASKAFTDWFTQRFSSGLSVGVVCGTGNNGGDGLAVSRMLLEQNFAPDVFVVGDPAKGSADFQVNYKRLEELGHPINHLDSSEGLPEFNHQLIIDAIFGSGLSRPVTGFYGDVIQKLNSSAAQKVSIDISSGLFSEEPTQEGEIVKADFTVAFQVPKLAFFMPGNEPFTGEWAIVDIGLNQRFIAELASPFQTIELDYIKTFARRRHRHFHKGNAGRALLVSGSTGKMGAAVLAARACLRGGCGLLTTHLPAGGNVIMQTAVPEAMTVLDQDEEKVTAISIPTGCDAVGIGPGLGTSQATLGALTTLLGKLTQPVVLDADGLNMLSQLSEGFALLPQHSIVTPHPKEFERMAGSWKNDFERLKVQREFAKKHHLIVVLKGAFTSIATPEDEVYFNTTGNPGMGTGGSGDVLTGLLLALLARGYTPLEAALLGVHVHGMAGDLAKMEVGEESLVASDLIDFLPKALLVLYDE